jgi:2-polyprenyl-3-methyl-5-hydroxy-6-metoxy-1,4-benzoquinol methylase
MMQQSESAEELPGLPDEFCKNKVEVISEEAVDLCPVCGCLENQFYASGYDYELQTCSNLWKFVKCIACGHVWLNPRPAISELPKIYPPNYYAYNYAAKINPVAVKAKMWMDQGKMRRIVNALSHNPKSFLDIGCGEGRFLKVMDRIGVSKDQNYGLELDENVVAPLRKEGFQAFCERVEDCHRIPAASIDLVTMFHVIEHVENPGAVVKQISKWLSPGGIFAIETPNLESLDSRIFRKTYWGGYHIPRHWNLFTEKTLSRLFLENGIKPLKAVYQTGHSFWMYSFHHWLRYGKYQNLRIAKRFDPFTGFLPFLAAFTLFDKIRSGFGSQTSAILMIGEKK